MDRSSDIEATSDTGLPHNNIGTNGNFDDFNDEIGSDDSQDGFREEETDGHVRKLTSKNFRNVVVTIF